MLAAAAAAWVLTANRMAGMDAGPEMELGRVGWFGVSWFVMMTAMMLAAAAPKVVSYGRRAVRTDATGAFAGTYLLTWLAAGLVGYAAIEAVRSLNLGSLAWGSGGRYAAAGVVAFADVYQLTAAKEGCLRRCRDRRRSCTSTRAGPTGRPTQGPAGAARPGVPDVPLASRRSTIRRGSATRRQSVERESPQAPRSRARTANLRGVEFPRSSGHIGAFV